MALQPKPVAVRADGPRRVYTTLKPPPPVRPHIQHREAKFSKLSDLHEGIEAQSYDLSMPTFEKETLEQEKDRLDKIKSHRSTTDWDLEKRKMEVKKYARELTREKPSTKYVPQDPIKKSDKLATMEEKIKTGKFFEVDHKSIINRVKAQQRNKLRLDSKPDYMNSVVTVGMAGHAYWKPLDIPLKD